MQSKFKLLFVLALSLSVKTFSQAPDTKQVIAEKLNSYFALERENIHLHLNKDTFSTEESIWFKGYAYNRKELVPFFSTMNVFVALYDQTGTKITQQLAYSNTGTFDGAFKNLENLPSGNYYIQVYTNWMNNFQENESGIYPIKIINAETPNFFDTRKTNFASAKIMIQPEGGTLVNGIPNTVGVKIVDQFNNPIGNVTAELKNSANKVVTEIPINKDGLGKFLITPINENYSVSVKMNERVLEQALPPASIIGIALEVNSYALPNKASVKIKTNAATLSALNSKKIFLVVHQDQRALIFDVEIDAKTLEKTVLFSTENMPIGVNTIRIVDEDMNQIAERALIKFGNSAQTFNLSRNMNTNGQLQLDGLSNKGNVNISVSILPVNTKATAKSTSITADLLYNSYLTEPIRDLNSYNPTLAQKYELDLAVLNQSTSKYKWIDITTNPPVATFEFDMGLTIKGQLLSPVLKNTDAYNIRLRSYFHQILAQSPINSMKEFEFKHLLMNDSTTVDFGLYKNTEATPLKLTHNGRITNGNRIFKYAFKGYNATELNQPSNTTFEDLPDFYDGSIRLKAVEVEVKKFELKRASNIENRNLRGFKVPESMTIGVITYIETNGFKVSTNGIDVDITTRAVTSINGRLQRPIIFLDNVQIRDNSFLQDLRMDDLDEIYTSTTAIVPSMQNYSGIIRMYRKTPTFSVQKTNLKNSVLTNAFARAPKFENYNYNSTSSQGFLQYGVINWIPFILTDENNQFEIPVPNYNQKKVKVLIEGFTFDGAIISETQIIDL